MLKFRFSPKFYAFSEFYAKQAYKIHCSKEKLLKSVPFEKVAGVSWIDWQPFQKFWLVLIWAPWFGYFFKFCGLLRIYKLHVTQKSVHIWMAYKLESRILTFRLIWIKNDFWFIHLVLFIFYRVTLLKNESGYILRLPIFVYL